MALLQLIPVCNNRKKILYYIERKPGDLRPSNVIVAEHKLNKINSAIQHTIKMNELNNKWQPVKKGSPKLETN